MRLRQLALALASTVSLASAAHAQTSLTFAGSQPNAYNNGSYLVGPFDGTFTNAGIGQSAGITIFCVDILNTVGYGDTFSVNVANLGTGAGLSDTRHPASLTAYREAAFLSAQFPTLAQSQWTGVQYAMWELMNPGSAPTDANRANYLGLASAAAAANFGAFTYNATNYAAFDYSRYSVLTDVRAAGSVDDSYTQEFISGSRLPLTTSTPEPASFALLGSGIAALVAVRRRRVPRSA